MTPPLAQSSQHGQLGVTHFQLLQSPSVSVEMEHTLAQSQLSPGIMSKGLRIFESQKAVSFVRLLPTESIQKREK
jgi:hypothetical protein